eukprot:gene6000-7475_t
MNSRILKNLYDVVIIGSGVSGLNAGHELKKAGYSVLVVEANNIIGGRTRHDFNFVSWPVELGGEMIHGGDTLYYKMAKENGWEIFEVFSETLMGSPRKSTYFYLGREKTLYDDASKIKDIDLVMDALNSISDQPEVPVGQRDTNLLEYLSAKGVPSRLIGLADCIYSKTWGTNLDAVGIREASREDKKYHKIPKNYKVQASSKVLVDHLSKGLPILTNWRANTIDYNNTEISITSYHNQVVRARSVVVTVPINILKDGDITFSPELPEDKKQSIQVLRMDDGMKIIAKFSNKFWGDKNVELILCADSPVPQIWMDGPPYRTNTNDYVVVGFITGDQATVFKSLPPKKQILTFLHQLDEMFGSEQSRKPASSNYLSHIVYNWSNNPFVRGAYTFPPVIPTSFKYSESPSSILAKNVNEKIFFAGEGTGTDCELATINGALVSGLRAAEEIKKSLPPHSSNSSSSTPTSTLMIAKL